MSDLQPPKNTSKMEVLENGPLSGRNSTGFEGKSLRV